ncbi:D-alanyl-D-alanine carboxypeptidase family protein [Bacillus sp. FJAT-42376]|uniref:M15 family metallopeptidase n=1 Tax=Bacillus sp. FJAT-42376 TaxID=2014076 RepID=UPI000F4EF096|nr:M15 family metallopeptidase [Bacillus sp. FJAT-42376]AZB43200.1 D-alanyl-D-alanine carboxypeptidase family protein [Bacillus sp. FJAT-42376]
MKKKIACAIVPLMIFSGACSAPAKEDKHPAKAEQNQDTAKQQADEMVLEGKYFNAVQAVNGKQIIKNPENILVLANKHYTLPGDYEPNDLVVPNVPFSFGNADIPQKYVRKEAAEALESLFSSAKDNDIELFAVSGYRSYKRQEGIFRQEIADKGEKRAEEAVALPGQSEHQTGLAMDISSRSVNLELTKEFGETAEGKWVRENAYKFGFIIRYLNDKENITEYMYEPWHLRYVGKETAGILHEKNLTLEEYFEQVKKI